MKWSNLILLPPTTIILTIILCTKALPLTTSRKSNHPKICLLLSMRKMIISKIKGIQTPRNQYKEKNKFPTFSPIKADPSHSFSICSLRNPIGRERVDRRVSRSRSARCAVFLHSDTTPSANLLTLPPAGAGGKLNAAR